MYLPLYESAHMINLHQPVGKMLHFEPINFDNICQEKQLFLSDIQNQGMIELQVCRKSNQELPQKPYGY